jgi:hypothetical protein
MLSLVAAASEEQQQQLNAQIESPSPPELSTDEHVPQMPQTYLTFLLISGKRRTMAFEPDTSIGRVKELVWNSWPAGVRFGRVLGACLLTSDICSCARLSMMSIFFLSCCSYLGMPQIGSMTGPLRHPIFVFYIWGECYKTMKL